VAVAQRLPDRRERRHAVVTTALERRSHRSPAAPLGDGDARAPEEHASTMPDGRHAALPLCDDDNRACERLSNGNYEDNTDGGTTPTKGVETGAGGTADLVAAADGAADDGSGPLLPLGLGGVALAAASLLLVRRRSVEKSD